jgi:transketolase
MEVFAPLDANEARLITTTVAHSPKPAYIRLVRPETPVISTSNKFVIGKSQIIQSGSDATVLGYGPILLQALTLKPSLEIINCSSIKPIDSETILKSIKKTGRCLVIEDHQKNGGLGDAVANLILSSGLKCKFISLGVDNQFGQSAKDFAVLYSHYNLDKNSIITALKKIL